MRQALRGLLGAPGYSLVVVATLALGIGAITAIFAVVYGVLLRPLPYPDSDSIVAIAAEKQFPGGPARIMNFSALEFDDWKTVNRAFASIAMTGGSVYAIKTDAGIESVSGAYVSDGFFDVLGLPMTIGRPLGADRDPLAIVSHRLWTSRFGGDPAIVGRSITINERAFVIAGVAHRDLRYPRVTTDLWMPMEFARRASLSPSFNNRNGGGFTVLGRLKPGVTLRQADEDVAAVLQSLEPGFNEHRRGMRAHTVRLATQIAGPIRPTLLLLLAAVALLLLVACANVANVMLARQTSRTREAAVRVALGASRGRLMRDAFGEAAVVAAAGSVAGAAFAWTCIALLRWLQPAQLPRLDDIRLDAPVLLFAMAAAALTVVVCGVAPAFHASRADVIDALKASRTQAGSRRGRRVRSALIVSELATATTLLIGATLVGRSLARLLETDLGINADNVISAQVDLSLGRSVPMERWPLLAGALAERIRALPGVQISGVGSGMPPNGLSMRQNFTLATPGRGPEEHLVSVVPATSGYFAALRIALVTGRFFTDTETADGAPVIVVTDDLARRLFGDRDPIGMTLPAGSFERDDAPSTIVGVVKNVKYTGIEAPVEGTMYRPFAQYPWRVLYVVARTASDPTQLAPALRDVIRSVDPQINIMGIRTVDQAVSDAVAQPRFRTILLASIAGLALLLAAVGLYGVIAYSVSQRTNEIGVRVALGARDGDVMRMVLAESLRLLAGGLALGLAGAYAVSQTLRTLLYGVTPADPLSFFAAAVFLTLVALAATYLPARRAARVDPAVALRVG